MPTIPTTDPSIVNYLNSSGQASDFTSRTALAKKYNINGYTGTADQNTQLLNYLRGASSPTPSAPTAPVAPSLSTPTTPTMPSLGMNSPTPTKPASSIMPQGSNIYNSSTGQYGYQVPGAQPLPGWSWVDGKSGTPAAPTSGSSLPTIPTMGTQNPTTPANGATGSGPLSLSSITSPVSSNETSNELLTRLLQSMSPSSEENDLQTKLTNLEASRRLSYQDLEKQPIATPFITGQEAAVDKSVNSSEQNYSGQLTNLQTQRGAVSGALTTALGLMKPTSLASGSELVDPMTGRVIAGANSAADKQAMDTFYNLQQSYPDAGIIYDSSKPWQENLTNAQKLVSNSPSFNAKNTVYAINPLTGQPQIVSKMGGSNGWDASSGGTSLGASSAPVQSSGGGAGSSLDVGASGDSVSALQNFLIKQGYSIPAGATGYYGAQTQAAVAAFQKANGIDTSGGGAGTFGPKTQTAASSKGFGVALGGGASQGGGAPASTGGPSMSVSQLAPELRVAYQDLGGVKFFDASKVNASQLPYLQRASQSTGVPLLTKEDANAIQTSYQAIKSSGSLVNEISTLVGNVINASNDPVSMSKQAAYLTAIEKAPSLFTDNDAKAFISARNSMLSLITRAAGEKGTLTDRDVARISEALPSYGDNAALAKQKAQNLSAVLDAVFHGSVQAYIGGGDTGSTGRGDEYQNYLKAIGQAQ